MKRFAVLHAGIAAVLVAVAAMPAAARADDFDSGRDYQSFGLGASSREKDREERPYSLSVGSGIAPPSESAFFGENPAGLIYNRRPSVLGYVASGPLHTDLLSNGLSLVGGNGLAAASLGIQSYNNAQDAGGNITTFNFGLATYAEFINVAVGLSGMYRFGGVQGQGIAEGTAATWTADVGFLYNPFGKARVGFMLYNLSQGVTAGSLGFAGDVNRFSTVTLDASTDNRGQGLTFKPGIGVRADHVHLAYSYGMQVDKNATSGITAGNTLGLGYEFNPSFRITGYYNQVVPYFLGATVSF